MRKVKPWLDTAEKIKHRHAALLVFLELTSEPEQAAFFREHRIPLYDYCLAAHRAFIGKLTEGNCLLCFVSVSF